MSRDELDEVILNAIPARGGAPGPKALAQRVRRRGIFSVTLREIRERVLALMAAGKVAFGDEAPNGELRVIRQ